MRQFFFFTMTKNSRLYDITLRKNNIIRNKLKKKRSNLIYIKETKYYRIGEIFFHKGF